MLNCGRSLTCAALIAAAIIILIPAGTAANCTFALEPASFAHSASTGSGFVSVTTQTGCTWTAVSNVSWITITGGATASGSGTVSYTIAANTAVDSRTGTIAIAGQTFQVTQVGGTCAFAISVASRNHGANAESGTVGVTAQTGCDWQATSNASWITITAGANGSGTATVSYSVAANTSTGSRIGTISIAGYTFTVTQAGAACVFSVSPSTQSYSSGAATGSIAVTTQPGCGWTAVSSASWITVTGGATGSGNGTVTYSVAANAATVSRNGTLTIGGQTVSINQAAAAGTPCSFTVSPTAQGVGATGGSSSVSVLAPGECAWSALSHADWIAITDISSDRGTGNTGTATAGNGTVTFTIGVNPGAARTGTLTIAGQTVTISQALACYFTISPTSRTHTAAGGSAAIAVGAAQDCSWTATSNVPWVTMATTSGTGGGTAGYTVAPNTGPERTGTLTVAGQTYTVTQAAGAASTCTFTISPTSRSHGAAAETGAITVTTQTACAWSAASNAPWVTITAGATGSGNGSVNYSVAANTGNQRSGTLTIGGQTFTVTQVASGTPAPTSIVDAASFGRGVAAGGLASLFGTAFATATAVADRIPLPATLAGVTVQLNGVALPLFFVSPTQINFQLPLNVPAGATLTVTFNGVTSTPLAVSASERAPAIFSMDATGRGQGVVIIAATGEVAAAAGSIAGRTSRPARRGEFISIFCSGLGPVTNPPAPGAAALANPLSHALLSPTVNIGGAPAAASFAGLAPGFVALGQVNVQVPTSAATGNAVPLTLVFPDGSSNTVTIAIE